MKKLRVALILALCSIMIFALAACAPKVDSLKSKYEKADYKVAATEKSLTAVKEGDAVQVTWYDSEDAAKKAEEDANKLKSAAVLALNVLGAKIEEKDVVVKRKGNVVAVGTSGAMKKF